MPKIYLSPAYHKWNPCAVSGCDETTHNNLYLDELEVYLTACGIDYKRGKRRIAGSNEAGTEIMVNAVKESNAYAPDIHYVSHTNAANGSVRGYRPIIYPGYSSAEKLADIIIKHRKEIYDMPINLSRRTDLYELYATTSIAYYEEHVFHDNKEDANWFHANLRKIAEHTCKAFCEYFKIPFVDPYEKAEPSILYRVRKSSLDSDSQAGAFTILQNAIALAQKTGLNVYNLQGNLIWQYETKEVPEENVPEPKEPQNEPKENSFIAFIKGILNFLAKLFIKK